MVKYDEFRIDLENRYRQAVRVARGRGAVASVSGQASDFGVSVLRDGGNAFDAAFAVAFALAIYHPQAGNLGGGGYLIYKKKNGRNPSCMNFREVSPEGVKREFFLDENGQADPERTAFGPTSVCVPGTVKAFFTLQSEHGVLSPADILTSLASRSRDGCIITSYQAECLNRLNEKLRVSPESRKVYGEKGRPYREGDRLPNPDLADTFLVLAREGQKAFYEGRIAERIEGDLKEHGGIITLRDLKNYSVKEVEPLVTELNGYAVWTVPPEGGGALLIEILNILNRDGFTRLAPFSAEFFHYFAQACKMASIDRMFYLGDVPLQKNEIYDSIFDESRSERLFSLLDGGRDISTEVLSSLMHAEKRIPTGDEKPASGSDTTHFSIIDSNGNAVSSSYTLNLRYGSKWSVDGMGFLLNGSMDAFSFFPGRPNYFGVIGNRPNLLAPGKRPASNMAPVLVSRGGEVEMVLGTPGGPSIPSALAQALFLLLVHRMKPEQVIQCGRVHHQGWPDVLIKESGGLPGEVVEVLALKGYKVQDKNEPIGDIHGVFREGKAYTAVSDYRREGCPSAL